MMLYDSTALRPSSVTFGSDLSTSFLVAFLAFLAFHVFQVIPIMISRGRL